ncbi:DNA alkylation repair protein [Kaarinaea lacus]
MQPLKDQFFNTAFYRQLSQDLSDIDSNIDARQFYLACTKNLSELELKQRMQRTADVCRLFFPDNYPEALKRLYAYAEMINENKFCYMFMPDFVARFGAHDFKRSMQALKDFTVYSSSELAIRVFLQNDFDRSLDVVKKWTGNKNVHIRRLASEGTRPRLPWAMRVKALLDNPDHSLPILQDLKTDNEKYVQKSVANHLNDISKDHPQKMLKLVKSWDANEQSIAWIIRHASRTLIKQGNNQALAIFGAHKKPEIKIRKFKLNSGKRVLGDDLIIELELDSLATYPQQLIIDYKIHYVKASGQLSPKVFKLKKFTLNPGQSLRLTKKQALKDLSTRKHYTGQHKIELLINGGNMKSMSFHLDTNPSQ